MPPSRIEEHSFAALPGFLALAGRARVGRTGLAALVCCALLVCGCSGTEGGDASAVSSDSTLRIALLPTVEALPLYVAEAEGIFDSLGLHVELLTYGAAMDADTAFWRGQARGLLTDEVKTALWQGDSLCLSVVLCAPLTLELVVPRGAGIDQLADLKDKIVALTRLSALDHGADELLRTAGLVPSDLNRPQINDLALRLRMTTQGQLDGALLPQPFAALALEQGAKLVCTGSGSAGACLILRDEPLEGEMERLTEAYDIACERINEQGITTLRRLPLDELPSDSLFALPTMGRLTMPRDSLSERLRQWAHEREREFLPPTELPSPHD